MSHPITVAALRYGLKDRPDDQLIMIEDNIIYVVDPSSVRSPVLGCEGPLPQGRDDAITPTPPPNPDLGWRRGRALYPPPPADDPDPEKRPRPRRWLPRRKS